MSRILPLSHDLALPVLVGGLPDSLSGEAVTGRNWGGRKKSTVKGASHSLLMGLWGKAVRKKWGGECILAPSAIMENEDHCEGKIEAHHIVKRHTILTRYYVHNGVTLCQYHHGRASFIGTQQRIGDRVGISVLAELAALQGTSFKNYLVRRGQTRADFLRDAKAKLVDYLGEPF